MTKKLNEYKVTCENCGHTTLYNSQWSKWISQNPKLDSIQKSLSVHDVDFWVHKYKCYGTRDIQCLMGVEVKTQGGMSSTAQSDTQYAVDQLLRNRKESPSMRGKFPTQADGGITKIKNFRNQEVKIKSFGFFKLTFSGNSPLDSHTITWGPVTPGWKPKEISIATLIELLSFEIDPDTFTPMKESLRIHTVKDRNGELF